MKKTFETRKIKDEDFVLVESIKEKASELEDLFRDSRPKNETIGSDMLRCLGMARGNLEQAVMWAVKGISRK